MRKTSETAHKKPAVGAGKQPSARAAADASSRLPAPGLAAPGDLLLTAEDISARLFIKPRTAALWARQGRLPAYRIGRKFGFKWEEVEKALPRPDGHRGGELKIQNEKLNNGSQSLLTSAATKIKS